MQKFLVFAIVISCIAALHAAEEEPKQFTEEEFLAELIDAGVSAEEATIYTCIAENVSGWRTNHTVVGEYSSDFGVFSISNAFWCSPPGKGCGETCESLLDNDIRNDIACAQTIKKIHGFTAWEAYAAYCL